jgi:hypothetical protein
VRYETIPVAAALSLGQGMATIARSENLGEKSAVEMHEVIILGPTSGSDDPSRRWCMARGGKPDPLFADAALRVCTMG